MTLRIRFSAVRLLLVLAALSITPFTMFGQATDSNIVGTVTDASGAVVSNATVVATNKDTAVKFEATSNSAGEYRINDVPVGRYDVAVTAAGFAPKTVASVQADLNHTADVNVTLAVGSVSTQVEITEAPALIESTTSTVQTTYNA